MKIPTKQRAEKRALKAFSDYIRERDNWTCYTCGKRGDRHNMDAGHMISRRFSAIKFDEINVHCQCVYCNKYLSGNLHEYIKKFLIEYGMEKYEQLDRIKNNYRKGTAIELVAIEQYFKDKLKTLMMKKGN
jgi:hypothetical protein